MTQPDLGLPPVADPAALRIVPLGGLGEIGLDFFVDKHDRKLQEFYFVEQLKLAREFDMPVLLHIRRAQDVILKHLRQIGRAHV